NAYDAKGLLIQAIRDDDPVVFCEHKLMYDLRAEVPDEPYAIPFGEANIVRDGDDVTVVALARMVHYANEAAETLAKEGIECELTDPRTTSPLDEDTTLESVERTGRLVVVDEATPRCSMATDIAALVADKAFAALKAPPRRVTAPHTPVPFAPSLERLYIPSPERIAAAVREVREYGRGPTAFFVAPAEAGVQGQRRLPADLASRLRGNDEGGPRCRPKSLRSRCRNGV